MHFQGLLAFGLHFVLCHTFPLILRERLDGHIPRLNFAPAGPLLRNRFTENKCFHQLTHIPPRAFKW